MKRQKQGSSVASNDKREFKVSKKSNKKQGKQWSGDSESDKGQVPEKTTQERGMGSEFANSVQNAINEAKDLKGSSNSFLGVDKQLLDPKDFVDSMLYDKKS